MYKPLPQVCPKTGISEDYWNQYNPHVVRLLLHPTDSDMISFLKARPIRAYTEVFDPFEWEADGFNHRIWALDALAFLIHDRLREGSMTTKDFVKISKEARFLIYGEGDHDADIVYTSLEATLK